MEYAAVNTPLTEADFAHEFESGTWLFDDIVGGDFYVGDDGAGHRATEEVLRDLDTMTDTDAASPMPQRGEKQQERADERDSATRHPRWLWGMAGAFLAAVGGGAVFIAVANKRKTDVSG